MERLKPLNSNYAHVGDTFGPKGPPKSNRDSAGNHSRSCIAARSTLKMEGRRRPSTATGPKEGSGIEENMNVSESNACATKTTPSVQQKNGDSANTVAVQHKRVLITQLKIGESDALPLLFLVHMGLRQSTHYVDPTRNFQ